MKKILKSMLSLALVAAITANFTLPTLAASNKDFPEEKIKKYEYVLQTENLDIQTGKKAIDGKTSKALSDINLDTGLFSFITSDEQVNGDTYVGNSEIGVEEPSFHKSFSANAGKIFVTNALISDTNIAFNSSTLVGSNAYIYSKNGDISINTGTTNIEGLLYAPNGTVYINGSNITISGAIIAKNIVVRTGSFKINYNEQVATMVTLLNETIIDKMIDLSAFHDVETDKIELFYYADFFKSADIYTRYGNGEFEKITTTDEMDFSLDTVSLTDYVDLRVVVKTSFGEEINSTITTLEKNENGIENVVRDSDGDRIPDGYEVWDLGTDPFNPDTDNDGFDDGYEVFVLHTDPTAFDENTDFDNDGLSNADEFALNTNPWLIDSDFDGIMDSEDENPTLTDTNTNKSVDYDVDVKVGKFDIVTQYADLNGNVTKNIYNYITGENKLTAYGDESVTYFYDNAGNVTAIITNTGDKQIANTYSYDKNSNLTAISHNKFRYDFKYDENSNLVYAGIGDRTLVSNVYDGDLPTAITYGNDDKLEAVYDDKDNLIAQKVDGETTYEWTYDENNNVLTHTDISENITFTYTYDDENIVTGISATNGFAISYEQSVDSYAISYNLNGETKTQTSESITKDNGEEEPEVIGSTVKLLSNGKLATVIIDENTYTSTISVGEKKILETTYATDGSQVSDIKYSDGSTISYSYDDNGNIVAIYENNSLTEKYTYDSLNQLIREDSAKSGTTTVYNYDNGGNILETKKYAYTDGELGDVLSTNTYTYSDSEWKDLLTAYNGQTITYDEIGNPLSYRDGFNFTWENGRQLASLQNKNAVVEYTYNSNGIRTSKTVNGVRTDYTLNNTTIIAETTNGKTTWYDYDASGMPVGFTVDEQSYYYKKNAQGDIVAILDSDGVEVAGYTYDAWGNITAISGDETLAESNPFRYRGYYQDNESGFFYLQSRYYDSGIGRFLNTDHVGVVLLTQGQVPYGNLFTYALNNPVNNIDVTGYFSMSINVAAVILDVFIMAVIPYLFTAFNATKLTYFSRNIFANTYKKAVKSLATTTYNAMDRILYNIMGKAANAATRSFTISRLTTIIDGIFGFSIGYAIAWIIDGLDKDKRNGRITF